MNVAKQYCKQVQPYKNEGKWENTRAEKAIRYAHYNDDMNNETSIEEKEHRTIELLKMALGRVSNPVVSCSFGIDSIVTLYLVRKALVEMGRNASEIDVVWNDTLNEFPAVRKYANMLTKEWNLQLLVYKPEKPLKKVIDDNGGITSEYFTNRKGSRKNGKPLSEKCCNTLKHKPMKKAIKENNWDLIINGLRADESYQRMVAGFRDGEFFYSSYEWKALNCRPILWWKNEDIWKYVKQEQIPFNDLYNENIIRKYPANNKELIMKNRNRIEQVGLNITELMEEQTQVVDVWQAHLLKELGYEMFTPRTGCQMCPIPVKYGGLQYMRLQYPKTYQAMIHNLGYGPALMDMVPDDVKREVKELTGIDMNIDGAVEHLENILESKPCLFDVLND